jgi:hypothetical protein
MADMGARLIHSSDSRRRDLRERRVLFSIVGSTAFALTLAYVLVALDLRPDLSEMSVRDANRSSGVVLIAWSALESDAQPRSGARIAQPSLPDPSTEVRMLGYMMDGNHPETNGAFVSRFVLMSDAGQLLHPAHLEPSRMIEVSLQEPVRFDFRRLIWASGLLNRASSKIGYGGPGWRMTNARTEPASSNAILQWFEP